jgi:hypothetical protein
MMMECSAAVRKFVLAIGLVAAVAPVAQVSASPGWFAGERVHGSGAIVKQSRDLGAFDGLELGMPGNVEVRVGGSDSVIIETDDNLQPLIETVIEDGILKIRPVRKELQLNTRGMKILVIGRKIDSISVGGSGNVDAEGLRGQRLSFNVGGSGSINVRGLESESMKVSLGGSGNFRASGHTEHLAVSIGGSGKVSTGQLASRNVSVSIGGSGQATVWARQSLSVSVAGSGDVSYYGDPQISKSIMGSGSIRRLSGPPQ